MFLRYRNLSSWRQLLMLIFLSFFSFFSLDRCSIPSREVSILWTYLDITLLFSSYVYLIFYWIYLVLFIFWSIISSKSLSISFPFFFLMNFLWFNFSFFSSTMGLSINDSVYSCLFFFLTGLHLFHLLFGLLLSCLLFWSCSFSLLFSSLYESCFLGGPAVGQ